jgi:hypothetical protein
MADLDGINSSQDVKLTGADGLYQADVVFEDGQKKLVVKSTIIPEAIGNLFFAHATNNGSEDMNVNGSGTPVDFIVSADATRDIIIESLAFESFASNIKIDKFLSLNQSLSNGILVEVKSEDTCFQFLTIKNTNEFDSHFAYGPGRSFRITIASGNDALVSRFGPSSPFVLKKQGTYPQNDYIKVTVSDNIQSINKLAFLAFGSYDV